MKPTVTIDQNILSSVKAGILLAALFFSVNLWGCATSSDQSKPDTASVENKAGADTQTFTFHKNENGSDILWKAVFRNGNIVSLYRNGEEIPSERIPEYEDLVYDNLNGVMEPDPSSYHFPFFSFHKFDEKKLNEKMKKLNLKLEKLDLDSCFAAFDTAKFNSEMEKLGERLKQIKIDFNFDGDKFSCNMHNFMKHHPFFESDKFKHDMEKLSSKLKAHAAELEDLRTNMPDLDKDMKLLRENMKDLKAKMKGVKKELRKLKSFMTDLRHELVKDGYLEDENEDFNMEFNSREMIVNGKKLPDNLLEKYKKMYKEHFGKDISDNNDFHIRK